MKVKRFQAALGKQNNRQKTVLHVVFHVYSGRGCSKQH